jgi:hypothetical protein
VEAGERDEVWRDLTIQPVVIPDLKHTGCRSEFLHNDQVLMRPDGSITPELRGSIQLKCR